MLRVQEMLGSLVGGPPEPLTGNGPESRLRWGFTTYIHSTCQGPFQACPHLPSKFFILGVHSLGILNAQWYVTSQLSALYLPEALNSEFSFAGPSQVQPSAYTLIISN